MSTKLSVSDLQKLEIGDRVLRIGSLSGFQDAGEETIVTAKTDSIVSVSVPNSVYEEKKERVIAFAKSMGLQTPEEIDEIFAAEGTPTWDFDLSTGKEINSFNPFGLTSYLKFK